MANELITIDYLIINLEGKLQKNQYQTSDYENINNFTFQLAERGTKMFASLYQVFYNDIRFGTLVCNPHKGSVMAEDFAQIQFDNALFYTFTLPELKSMFTNFIDSTGYSFKSVNRCDIAIDRMGGDNYRQLASDILQGKILLAGRTKDFNTYNISQRGRVDTTGIQVGKRSASRMLRIYNKTLQMKSVPKEYIEKWHEKNGFTGEIWRFEYQLNAIFFRELFNVQDITHKTYEQKKQVIEKFTWGVFDIANIVELAELAERNHFELRQNTGKSQINKEKPIVLNAWDKIRSSVSAIVSTLRKIPKIIERSTVIKKRLAKSLFREYYVNEQDITYCISLNKLLHDNSLVNWFHEKINYYLAEFREKEKIRNTFCEQLYFNEHSFLFL